MQRLTSSLLLLSCRPPSLFRNSTFSAPQYRSFGPSRSGSTSYLSVCTCLYLSYLVTLPRISVDTENSSRGCDDRSFGANVRSFPARPLNSFLCVGLTAFDPRTTRPSAVHPFLSAPGVLSVGPPHISGNDAATAIPACIHRRPVITIATRKASATRRVALRWTRPKAPSGGE